MKIRTKIAIQFSIIVSIILLCFSLSIYFFTESSLIERFYVRIFNHASTTARLLSDVDEIDNKLLALIDKSSTSKLPEEAIQVYTLDDSLVFSNLKPVVYPKSLLDEIKVKKEIRRENGKKELVGLLFKGKLHDYVVVATASDEAGKEELRSLKSRLVIGFFIVVAITIISSMVFAKQALKPINSVIKQIDDISANDLSKRIDEGNKTDEIAQLSMKFNEMLERLQKSFEQQRDFVTHASHELRTPLASLKSEIELGLDDEKLSESHRETLQNIHFDVQRLIELSNNILQLARPFNSNILIFNELRVDEVMFQLQSDLQKKYQECRINVDFEKIANNDELLTIMGNELLIRQVFINLISNSLKYSEIKQVWILIDFDRKNVNIKIKDKGIGIHANDLEKIFEPFYRSQNAIGREGFGIGLAICKKIIDAHGGKIIVSSEFGKGSVFTVSIPHLSI
ncbi:MAG: HAMP domain-containing histidine kinase [Spirosomaceae bacterium]|nr:HAMP domain-containing histidine kinase [Spirosomataceae bacterium]